MQVEVKEVDREAYLAMSMLPEFDAADVRAGRWDKTTGMQAFARHREAARIEGIRLGLEAAAGQKRYQFICWIADRFIEKHVTPLDQADALFMAAAALESSEEDAKFGDPDYGWTEDDAHALADEEIIAGWESA